MGKIANNIIRLVKETLVVENMNSYHILYDKLIKLFENETKQCMYCEKIIIKNDAIVLCEDCIK